MRRLVNSSVG